MNNFFTYIYFSWDIYSMAAPITLFCFYFKTTEKVSWKAKKWIRQNLTFDNNSGRLDIEISKPLGLLFSDITSCHLKIASFRWLNENNRLLFPITGIDDQGLELQWIVTEGSIDGLNV